MKDNSIKENTVNQTWIKIRNNTINNIAKAIDIRNINKRNNNKP
jgi:hypothetical protein